MDFFIGHWGEGMRELQVICDMKPKYFALGRRYIVR